MQNENLNVDKGNLMRTNKLLAALILLAVQVLVPSSTSMAVTFKTTTVTEIQKYPPYIQDAQKVRRFEVGLSAENPDIVIFNAIFMNGITPTSMAQQGNRIPLMRVKIFYSPSLSESNSFQYSIDAPTTPYQGETKIPATVNSQCGAKTWMPQGLNGISFEISRNCLDLPDKFYVALLVDVDINQSNNDFVTIPEKDAVTIDYTNYPKPAKPVPKKDQVISAYTSQSSYTLDVTTVNFNTSTNSGLPIQIVGMSPNVCSVTSSNTISIFGEGVCTIKLESPGNDLWNSAIPTSFTFNVLPKKPVPKVDQKLYFNRPGTLNENSGEYRLDIYSDSGLTVKVTSSTPNVCSFPYQAPNNTVVKIFTAGTCRFTVSQSGNDRFNPTEGWTEIEIEPIQKATPVPPSKKTPAPVPSVTKKPPVQKGIEITVNQSSTEGSKSSGTAAKSGTGVNKTGTSTITCMDSKTKKLRTYDNKKVCPSGSIKK